MDLSPALKYLKSIANPRVTSDSREVQSGDLFAAVKGGLADGHNFIRQAEQNGAGFIVYQNGNFTPGTPSLKIENSRKALGILSNFACGNPSDKLCCLAVTGTNGKTTTASLSKQLLEKAGIKTGLIGTVWNDLCGSEGKSQAFMTTPPADSLSRMLQKTAKNGGKAVCIEASSHALDQERLAGVKIEAAAFTNLSGEHLDYHKTLENYFAAKKKLFHRKPPISTAVINLDSPEGRQLAGELECRVIGYSLKNSKEAAMRAKEVSFSPSSARFKLCWDGRELPVQTRMTGRFNISNQLAAAGLALAAGLDIEQIAQGLKKCAPPKGRLERVPNEKGLNVFVDYAHTDDALENVLRTLRGVTEGRLITVFGCGGCRDKAKRPRMAEVSERYSDVSIITNDNPRTEDPDKILDEISEGFSSNENVLRLPDREKAIEKALSLARPEDAVLIAGKGHEEYQDCAEGRRDFSDTKTARMIMEK
ncbi:UDP-N-acetylmuramoyl-L-alanyl-D-glutamate--2,6-diaminopimelate ligase [Sedimentisphaera cyanobacteriorum]|uniref:UDP-N-acetylmuramoyl-L-alanyl-D-glutamate--2,6-diaminopimelate ligase n=1 Tax=Sedimentisphaera cyanobacteriorum TaxID=1940790 RepID=A0A1Q2HQB0_9BACT|nr:UDP-N-acetylmuramoyl-L-alanyl-D-glutamate--2,6-diaminopimelate ligase [Sedimentisphaera cyanobacteriorum]AQQ09550.1 UDP-N-acetylmuramoyl-L-alanyl-D-glutamate--2,6-diaminopimelate ligase [Sedimentisphaera cyanobacteriorum]